MKYITASGSTTVATSVDGLLVQINKGDASATITLAAGGNTFAVIAGPYLSGYQYRYNGLRGQGAITVNPSATTDLTVSFLNRQV